MTTHDVPGIPVDPALPSDGGEPAAHTPTLPVSPLLAPQRQPVARRRSPILPVAIALVVVLAGSALFMSGYMVGHRAITDPGTPITDDEAFQPFWDTYHTIQERYAGGDVDRDALVQGAIKGMIGALGDPYSAYLTSDEYKQSLQSIGGQFEGIGATIGTQATDGSQGCATLGTDCHLLVIAPIEGSPAEKAGLKAGDLVLAADGVSLEGLTVDTARDKVRGPKGSVVKLTIKRGDAAPFDVSITRDVVQELEVVTKDLAEGTVAYIKLNGFSDAAAVQLHDALAKHIAAGQTKVILDLRGNPGGYVTAARAVASEFIGSGVIFWEQDAAGNQVATNALPDGVATAASVKVVCLVDGGSASASEIVAGALQDSGRATLVGQRSFGKGTVQQWQELTGEGGAFKLTIARWLTPTKRWIHGKGLTPDVVVTIPADAPAEPDLDLDQGLKVLGVTGDAGRLAAA